MTTRRIPRPKPEIPIKSQSKITNPPTIATERDFFRRWGGRLERDEGEKFMTPL